MNPELRQVASVEAGIRNSHSTPDGTVLYLEYEPGNGTWYQVLVTSIGNDLSPDAREAFGMGRMGSGWLVSLVNTAPICKSVLISANSNCLHWQWVQDHLKVSKADAMVLAELLGHQFKRPFVPMEECEEALDAV